MLYLIGVYFYCSPSAFAVAGDDSIMEDCVWFDKRGKEKLFLICK